MVNLHQRGNAEYSEISASSGWGRRNGRFRRSELHVDRASHLQGTVSSDTPMSPRCVGHIGEETGGICSHKHKQFQNNLKLLPQPVHPLGAGVLQSPRPFSSNRPISRSLVPEALSSAPWKTGRQSQEPPRKSDSWLDTGYPGATPGRPDFRPALGGTHVPHPHQSNPQLAGRATYPFALDG